MGNLISGCFKTIVMLVIIAVVGAYFLSGSDEDDGERLVNQEKLADAKGKLKGIAGKVISEGLESGGLENVKNKVVEGVKEKAIEKVKEQVDGLASGSTSSYERMLDDATVARLCSLRGFPQGGSKTALREGSYEIVKNGTTIKAIFRKERSSDSRIIGRMKLMADDSVLDDCYVAYGGGSLYTMYVTTRDLGTNEFDVFYAKPSSILIYTDASGLIELHRR